MQHNFNYIVMTGANADLRSHGAEEILNLFNIYYSVLA